MLQSITPAIRFAPNHYHSFVEQLEQSGEPTETLNEDQFVALMRRQVLIYGRYTPMTQQLTSLSHCNERQDESS